MAFRVVKAVRAVARDLIFATGFLTRLPLPVLTVREIDAARSARRCVWAFPLVGAFIGLIGGLTLSAAGALGLPIQLQALVALATTVLLTGCLHEDGFADFWDGIGGGRTRERKLEIMRDARMGSYGGTALFFSFLARWAALVHLADFGIDPVAVLVSIHAASRGLIGIVFLLMSANPRGLRPEPGADLGNETDDEFAAQELAATGLKPPNLASAVALLLSIAIPALMLPMVFAIIGIVVGGIGVGLIAYISWRNLGGYTGDVHGASEQAAEIGVLLTFAALI